MIRRNLRLLSQDQVASLYPLVALDFDGTLAEYHGWTGVATVGDPYFGTRMLLEYLVDDGYHPYILTARRPEDIPPVEDWVYEHGFDDLVWFVTNVKHPAVAILDDYGVRFDGNPGKAYHDIKSLRPWWQASDHADGPTKEQARRLGIGGKR